MYNEEESKGIRCACVEMINSKSGSGKGRKEKGVEREYRGFSTVFVILSNKCRYGKLLKSECQAVDSQVIIIFSVPSGML